MPSSLPYDRHWAWNALLWCAAFLAHVQIGSSWILEMRSPCCWCSLCSHWRENYHQIEMLLKIMNKAHSGYLVYMNTKAFLGTNAGFRLTCRSPLCRYAAWSSLAVSELQLSAATPTPLWLFTERQSLQSWIEFNCLRSAAVGRAARLSIYWLDAACCLVIPLRQVTLAQLN